MHKIFYVANYAAPFDLSKHKENKIQDNYMGHQLLFLFIIIFCNIHQEDLVRNIFLQFLK